jgi:hypothetical protein
VGARLSVSGYRIFRTVRKKFLSVVLVLLFMAVTVNDFGKFRTAEGTLAEVVGQLDDDGRTRNDVMGFEYDGSQYAAVYQIK